MEINYLIVFLFALVVFAYLSVTKLKNFSWKSLEDIFYWVLLFPSIASSIICLVVYCFSSVVVEIKSNQEYKKSDYVFFYKDCNDDYHIVLPFIKYISNASDRDVVFSEVGYGKYKSYEFDDKIYEPGKFRSINKTPDYYFREAPQFIRSKSSKGEIKSLINYK